MRGVCPAAQCQPINRLATPIGDEGKTIPFQPRNGETVPAPQVAGAYNSQVTSSLRAVPVLSTRRILESEKALPEQRLDV